MALFCCRCQQFLDRNEAVCPTCGLDLDTTAAILPTKTDRAPEIRAVPTNAAARSSYLEIPDLQPEQDSRDRRIRVLLATNKELQEKNRLLEILAMTDPLTGLPNRRAMDRLARRELQDWRDWPVAIGLVDIDRFSDINLRYSLVGGDTVLIVLGSVLQSLLRCGDAIARIGGEKFVILAPGLNWIEALALGQRIRAAVEENRVYHCGEIIPVSVSVGFAVAGQGITDYAQLLREAAAALAASRS